MEIGRRLCSGCSGVIRWGEISDLRIKTEFIKRESLRESNKTLDGVNSGADSFKSIFYRYIYEVSEDKIHKLQDLYDYLYGIFWRVIEQKFCTKEDVENIEKGFDEFFKSDAVRYADIDYILRLMQKIQDFYMNRFDLESRKMLMNLLFTLNSNMSMALTRQFRLLEGIY